MSTIHSETAIEYLPPESLTFYIHNAKIHKRKLEMLKRSIQLFGFDQPVVVDEDLIILKGHGRVMAAQNLSSASRLKEIPVIVRTGLSEAQKKAVRLMDNMVFEQGVDNLASKSEVMQGINVEEINLFYAVDLPSVKDIDLNMFGSGNETTSNGGAGAVETTEGEAPDFKLLTCPKCGKVHKVKL